MLRLLKVLFAEPNPTPKKQRAPIPIADWPTSGPWFTVGISFSPGELVAHKKFWTWHFQQMSGKLAVTIHSKVQCFKSLNWWIFLCLQIASTSWIFFEYFFVPGSKTKLKRKLRKIRRAQAFKLRYFGCCWVYLQTDKVQKTVTAFVFLNKTNSVGDKKYKNASRPF